MGTEAKLDIRSRRAVRAAKRSAKPVADLVDAAELDRRRVRADKATPVITRYHKRREITDEQHRAAERLWSDFARSGLDPWARSSYGDSDGASGPRSPGCGPRYASYAEAMRAVGPTLSPILHHVICEDKPASSWAADNNRSATDGIAGLRFALDALATHYGYLSKQAAA